MCLIASGGGEQFQCRCREYPNFTKNVNFLWFPHWERRQLIRNAAFHLRSKQSSHLKLVCARKDVQSPKPLYQILQMCSQYKFMCHNVQISYKLFFSRCELDGQGTEGECCPFTGVNASCPTPARLS